MEIRSLVTKDDKYQVEIEERYTFQAKKNIHHFKELFEIMNGLGYLKNNSFNDLVWTMPCPSTLKDVQFDFNLGKYRTLADSLKSYILLRRKAGKVPSYLGVNLRLLKKVIISTDGLRNKKSVKEYFLKPINESELYDTCYLLANYLTFNQIPKIKEVVDDIFQGLKSPVANNRELPPFQDVLTFDDCVNKFFSCYSMDETFKWYPILIWWNLTNKLPMRPIDLLRTKSNCLDIKKDGSYWITIPRHKQQLTDLDRTYVYQTLQIDKENYQMIREFQMRLEEMGIESEFLIPSLEKIHPRFRAPTTMNKDAPSDSQHWNLITFFYEEVVEGKYGEFHLNRVTPGDTRHFAIMNLFLQGYNVLTIARLAGHDEITSPANYFTHAKFYAKSAVYKLAQRKTEDDIGSTMRDGFFGWRDKQVRRAKDNLDDENEVNKWRKVDFGFCKDIEDFPNNCLEDCRFCQEYYVFKPSVNDWRKGIQWFESVSKELEENAINTLNLMATISTTTYETLKGLETMNENESKSLSIQFFKYLDHKAIIDARILEEKLKERYPDAEQ
jgi:hypothetical protein